RLVVVLDLEDQFVIRISAAEMLRRRGTMTGQAVVAIVLGGNVGRDNLPLRRSQGVWASQQNLHQLAQRLGRFRAEHHGAADTRQSFSQFNVGHFLILDSDSDPNPAPERPSQSPRPGSLFLRRRSRGKWKGRPRREKIR